MTFKNTPSTPLSQKKNTSTIPTKKTATSSIKTKNSFIDMLLGYISANKINDIKDRLKSKPNRTIGKVYKRSNKKT